jgi:hypothetical protein
MHVGLHYSCKILMKLFSPQIFEKYSIIKFHENPSSGSSVVPCGRTNRRTILQVCLNNIQNMLLLYSYIILLYIMYVPFSVFCVLFVCKCVLYYCHRVSTQLQLNIYIISYHIPVSLHIVLRLL